MISHHQINILNLLMSPIILQFYPKNKLNKNNTESKTKCKEDYKMTNNPTNG